jgi:hypothetical protein
VRAVPDPEPAVREAAWAALDPAEDELAIPLLGDALGAAEERAGADATRARLLHALRGIAERAGGPVALPADAIARAAAATDQYVRAAAVRLGAHLPDRARAHELVLAGLGDDEGWVRESAARGAAEAFGPPDRPVLPRVQEALAAAREDPTRLALLRALAAIAARPAAGDGGMTGLAQAMLTSDDAGVRAAALLLVGVCATEGSRELALDLGRLLGDAHEEIRQAAARLLGDLAPAGCAELLAPLEAAVAAPASTPPFRRALACAARRLRLPAALPLLRRLTEDADLGVARAAAEALADLAEAAESC